VLYRGGQLMLAPACLGRRLLNFASSSANTEQTRQWASPHSELKIILSKAPLSSNGRTRNTAASIAKWIAYKQLQPRGRNNRAEMYLMFTVANAT
jgi:hypothetical protein